MAKAKLTPDELKDLEDYLKESDALAEQEPKHMEDVLTPEEYGQVSDYLLTGKGDRPAAADRFTVSEVITTDSDGVKRKHKTFYDTELENWNKKCADLYEKHQDTIAKALSIWLNQTNQKGGLQTTTDIVRSLLDKNPPPADFEKLPSSQEISFILDAFVYGNNIQDIEKRNKFVSNSSSYSVQEKGDSRVITRTTKNSELMLQINNIANFAGNNDAALNVFVLALIEANKQAIHNGRLTRDYVTFPLQELVDLGSYKTIKSARNAFNKGSDALTDIKIKGHQRKNKYITEKNGLILPFTDAYVDDSQCYLSLNPHLNWGSIAEFVTIIPRYCFKLRKRPKILLLYIFDLARQRTKEIATKGYFTISFRAIQRALDLPNEVGLNNPQRDIKDVIENAIVKIEDANHKYLHSTDFQLLTVNDDYDGISDYLDNGYLKVTLKGKYAEFFVNINQKTAKKVATSQKRRERIQDNAKTKALADKMGNDDSTVKSDSETNTNDIIDTTSGKSEN